VIFLAKYFHSGQFLVTYVTSLNAKLGRDAYKTLAESSGNCSSTPLREEDILNLQVQNNRE
jgi:hypothetical protein